MKYKITTPESKQPPTNEHTLNPVKKPMKPKTEKPNGVHGPKQVNPSGEKHDK